MDAPPAIHFSVPPAATPIDYDRVLRVILALEGGAGRRWELPGGALGWQPASWREDSKLDYEFARNPWHAKSAAKARLSRFAKLAAASGITWTPRLCFESWRWGKDDAFYREKKRLPSSYALRGQNLFEDPTFK